MRVCGQLPPMSRSAKLALTLAVLAGLFLAGWLAFTRLVPSNDELARRAEVALGDALGVKVTIGALHWRLLPAPSIVMENAATSQDQPITLHKLTARLEVAALFQRRIRVTRAEVDGAVVPQLSLRELKTAGDDSERNVDEVPLARLEFRDVTWVTRRGTRLVFEGDADFDTGWRPRLAHLRRPGAREPTDLTLTRKGPEDRWAAEVNLGGGTANGEVQLVTRPNGRLNLQGSLSPRQVEVSSAMQACGRPSLVSGKASGETTLSANGDTLAELARSLHTKTLFTMAPATLTRFDVDKVIRSGGKEHAGQTALETLSGQMDTQNTPKGMVVDYSNIKAKSGAFTASGRARVANRQVEAELAVDLVDGWVGVPLVITGPLDNVKFSVPGGAVAGAVVGTAVLPGVGTALGARIGATLGKVFSKPPSKPAPAGNAR